MTPELQLDNYKSQPYVDGKSRSWGDFSYTKLEKIGQGTKKVCWRARIGNTDRAVLKEVFQVIDVEEMKHYLEVLNYLKGHPRIVTSHDFFWTKHRTFPTKYKIYLIQDLYTQNLVFGINRMIFGNNPALIHSVFIQLAEGLEYIHGKGVIVNDIKLDNIYFICENGTIRVAYGDFGGADLPNKSSTLSTVSENYLSPDRINNTSRSMSDDIFSLSICFALIPHDRKNRAPLFPYMAMKRNSDSDYLPYVHAFYHNLKDTYWKPLIGKMMADIGKDRPTATLILKDLRAIQIPTL